MRDSMVGNLHYLVFRHSVKVNSVRHRLVMGTVSLVFTEQGTFNLAFTEQGTVNLVFTE